MSSAFCGGQSKSQQDVDNNAEIEFLVRLEFANVTICIKLPLKTTISKAKKHVVET